jgi:threonine/homoserine/homoserine lactone efflux protein
MTLLEINATDPIFSWKKTYLKGCLTNILNPKVILFFLAFLPQFIIPDFYFSISTQLFILGTLFTCSGTLINILVALFFGYTKKWLMSHPQALNIQQKITGMLLIGFGLRLMTLEKI